ncbi:MAG TPA: DNA methyltransferase [Flavobacteriales bacterium]|nr:DNA methyltransferase [Flavobacteriales bacterium]
MSTTHTIITGDSRSMDQLQDGSVQLIVTSPPYWQLKDYGSKDQIGYHGSYEEYINDLNLVWQECDRVLSPGCRLCINIGDQFARTVYYGRYKVIPIRTEIIRFCEALGMDYMGAVIWQKVTTTNTTGGAAIMGSFPNPRNGILKIDYEFILIFKKPGAAPKPTVEQKQRSAMTTEQWNQYFAGHWNFAGAKQEGHLAMFPEELPARLIQMFSFHGEKVLDPFLGSGTTALAARNLGRSSVGYEINPEFIPVIKTKLNVSQVDLAGSQYEFKDQGPKPEISAERKNRLPYLFQDPHRMDKKIDARKLTFGSRISEDSGEREEYFTVKEVVSPEIVRLSNDLVVRLIGVKPRADAIEEARSWLEEATKGQRVYLRYDADKHDEQDRLRCYLYLKNKTFLNAHLVKKGLVDVDDRRAFKYKERFERYAQEVIA